MSILNHGAAGLGAGAVRRTAASCSSLAVAHATERMQFGRPLVSFGRSRRSSAAGDQPHSSEIACYSRLRHHRSPAGVDYLVEGRRPRSSTPRRVWTAADGRCRSLADGYMREQPSSRRARLAESPIFEERTRFLRASTFGLTGLQKPGEYLKGWEGPDRTRSRPDQGIRPAAPITQCESDRQTGADAGGPVRPHPSVDSAARPAQALSGAGVILPGGRGAVSAGLCETSLGKVWAEHRRAAPAPGQSASSSIGHHCRWRLSPPWRAPAASSSSAAWRMRKSRISMTYTFLLGRRTRVRSNPAREHRAHTTTRHPARRRRRRGLGRVQERHPSSGGPGAPARSARVEPRSDRQGRRWRSGRRAAPAAPNPARRGSFRAPHHRIAERSALLTRRFAAPARARATANVSSPMASAKAATVRRSFHRAWARSVFSSSRILGELGDLLFAQVQLVGENRSGLRNPRKRRRRSLLRSRATDQPANPVRLHLHWRLRRRRSRACARFFHHHIMPGCIASSNSPGLIRSRRGLRRGHHASRSKLNVTCRAHSQHRTASTRAADNAKHAKKSFVVGPIKHKKLLACFAVPLAARVDAVRC